MGMASLPPEERQYYNAKFDEMLRSVMGTPFQSLFQRLMTFVHGDRFQTPRPHGNVGDFACDGYLNSENKAFQCYSPERLTEQKAKTKLSNDLARAKAKWQNMQKWVYVVNLDAVPAPLVQAATLLSTSQVETTTWGRENLRQELAKLDRVRLIQLLGAAEPFARMERITSAAVAKVIERIELRNDDFEDLAHPSSGKMDYNSVGQKWRINLRVGMAASAQVRQYMEELDPTVAGKIQSAIRADYVAWKSAGLSADECLDRIADFLSSAGTRDAEDHLAVLAVISYFFEACDILEPEPPMAVVS